jgi:hypothetical protein
MLREAYYALYNNRTAKIWGEQELSDNERHHSRFVHVGHCFDYLRQAIMCAGDMTLEWAGRDADGNIMAGPSGWGILHRQCRNWGQAYEWAAQHNAPGDYAGTV